MSNELTALESREILGKTVTAFGTVENPLFDSAIIAEAIEYNKDSRGIYNVSKMLETIDEDEKVLVEVQTVESEQCTHSKKQGNLRHKKWFLTEGGLYEVLFLSRKPLAREFKRQVKRLLHDLRTGNAQLSPEFSHLEQENIILRQKLQVFEEHSPAKFYDYDETAALCAYYRKPPFGREHLKRWLVEQKILCKQAAKNEKPIQYYLNLGWFVPVIHEWYRKGRRCSENRYYITPKGLMGMIELMIRDNLLHVPSVPQRVFPEIFLPSAPLSPEVGVELVTYTGGTTI